MSINRSRVFFHELGHFVAHELNFKNFGLGAVDRIEIFYHSDKDDYSGKLVPFIPEGIDKKNESVKDPPSKLAELVYGCYFQSFFHKKCVR